MSSSTQREEGTDHNLPTRVRISSKGLGTSQTKINPSINQ